MDDSAAVANRISTLPDDLLSDVIARLPTKDAAWTTTLSTRWRFLWAATPLCLDDEDLIPHGRGRRNADLSALAAPSSRAVASHPGPVRSARFFCDIMEAPAATATSRAGSAPGSRMAWHPRPGRPRDIGRLLTRSRALDTLALLAGYRLPLRVGLSSRSLRCVVTFKSFPEELSVCLGPDMVAHRVEWMCSTKVKIRYAPRLRAISYLNPAIHKLKIGNTVIKAGMEVGSTAMLPSVTKLAMLLWLGDEWEAKMVATFLKCFPRLETLYIMSAKLFEGDEDDAKFSADFWQELGSVECVRSCIKKLVFEGFRGEPRELMFLGCITESAQMLERVDIIFDLGAPTSMRDVAKDDPFRVLSFELVSGNMRAAFLRGKTVLSYVNASDMTRDDPFDCLVA
ncbi:hypothetical protein ACP70R_041032 [Stipagrostis hirtigluma subsp. patula]